MGTPADRLVEARQNAGCDSAQAGADRTGVKYDTYVQHERGARGISKSKAAVYARAFGVDAAWLLYGRGGKKVDLVELIGRVGANPDGRVLLAHADRTHDRAPIPFSGITATAALEVAGHSMPDFAEDGALIYIGEQLHEPTPEMFGRIVVAQTDTDEVLVKRLLRGSAANLYDLQSIAGPLRQDVRLTWVARITAIVPPPESQRLIVRASEAPHARGVVA